MARIEVNPEVNSTVMRGLRSVVGGWLARAADRLTAGRKERAERVAERVAGDVRGGLHAIIARGEELRGAAAPRPVPGAGMDWNQFKPPVDARQQSILSSPDARRGRVFARPGPVPSSLAPRAKTTLDYISQTHRRLDVTGFVDRKIDLDLRLLRRDSHYKSVDRIRRTWAYAAPFRLKPANASPLAHLVCNATQAAIDQLDAFDRSTAERQTATGSGFSLGECIWTPRRLFIPVSANTTIVVPSETVSSVETINGRHAAFDIVTDDLYIDQGGNNYVDPLRDELGRDTRKVVYHKTLGDEQARQNGFHFAGSYLCYSKGLSLDKWLVVIETHGAVTPYLERPDDVYDTDESIDEAEQALADHGKGIPTMLPKGWGPFQYSQTPTGVIPMHQAILGYLNSEQSKLVVSNTLTQEMGGVGSYNASSTHQDQQEATQRMDARDTALTYRAQLLRYIVDENAEVWARAFAPYVPGGCSPEDVKECVPLCFWDLERKLSRPERLKMFIDAKAGGLLIDATQGYDECGFRRAMSPETAFGHEPGGAPAAAAVPAGGTAPAAPPPAAPDEGEAGEPAPDPREGEQP